MEKEKRKGNRKHIGMGNIKSMRYSAFSGGVVRRIKASCFGLFIVLSFFATGFRAQPADGADSTLSEERANTSSGSNPLEAASTVPSKWAQFVFEDPSYLPMNSLYLCKYDLLKWNSSEKEFLLEILAEIDHRFPMLMRTVKELGPISIFRVKHLRSASTINDLVSGPGYILVSDEFSLAPNKREALMHELVHLIDSCGEQAYHPRWVKRMLPSMWKSKLIVQFLTYDEFRSFSQTLPQISDLPSLYATTNFRELLAEEVSTKLSTMPEQEFTKFSPVLLMSFLHPQKDQIERNRSFMEAMRLYKQEKFKEAIKLLRQTKTPSARTVMSNLYLATCYFNTDQMEESLAECKNVLRKAKILELMDVEETELQALITKSKVLIQKKQYEQAKEALNLALHRSPANRYCLRSRSLCNFELGCQAEGLLDLFRAKGLDKLICEGLKCGDYCPTMTVELLESVTHRTKSIESLYIKSAAFHGLASTATDKVKRHSYLNSAVDALMEVMEHSESYRAQTHAHCGLICIEKGDFQSARIHFDKALGMDKENIPAMIGKAKLLELLGKKQESSSLCKEIRERLDLLKDEELEVISNRSLHALSKDEAMNIVQFSH
ncbi:MAG: hypothetical protein IPK73_25445 [Candidatus Obscuribacter sp.]|nr:hypothetical protein [Candidatus Obscuribacter sp.]MBK9277466.1 hypothetical protein [Candidatus Obscuribacter sp.]